MSEKWNLDARIVIFVELGRECDDLKNGKHQMLLFFLLDSVFGVYGVTVFEFDCANNEPIMWHFVKY